MTPLPLVLVTHTLPEDWMIELVGRVHTVVGPVDATFISASLERYLPSVEGLFSLLTIPIRKDLLDKMPKLRVVSNMAVGVDNIDILECTLRGIPVGNTPGILTDATADLTVALLLSICRCLPQSSADAKGGKWVTWSPTGWLGRDLSGGTLGIIGMGKIGKAVARRAMGFGMRVLFYDPSVPEIDKKISALKVKELNHLFQESDFISLHCPLTNATRGLINGAALQLMKPLAILINTARGPIIKTDDLVKALRDGKIGGAALDVTDPEPLPKEHALYSLPNCLISPHIGSATYNTRKGMAKMAIENLLAGLEGRKLPYCVNPEIYE